jgi:hypothetical protein
MKKLYLLFTVVLALLLSIRSLAAPVLNSLPGATAVIFLDFDGHYVYSSVWNGGSPLACAASGMTEAQITEAFNRTAEDYRPFDINITTDSAVFLAAPLNKRFRVIITPTSGWYPGVGGVTYIGSFVWGDDTPGFVFCDRLGPNSPKMVGECCSHESGHAVGLSHQSKYGSDCVSPIEQYNSGIGSGEPGWAPIMGNSYYKNLSNWNNGPTPYGCTNMQDNLSIITTQNGFGYRADDYTEIMNGTTTTLTSGNFTKQGVISTNTDKDAFKFTVSQNSSFHLTAIPFNVGANYIGANLDIKLQLYNVGGALINTYDPANTLSITIDTVLNSGTYYLKIDGSGNTNIGEYGSLGAYTLSGTGAALPIHDVALTGNADNGKHNLAWNIIADESIKEITIETSADGLSYKSLTSVAGVAKNFSYNPFQSNVVYYRLKVVSELNQIVYSNTIVLKAAGKSDNIFKVSTFINSQITVHAALPYQYQLSDINGNVINKGNGAAGFNSINVGNQPKGVYIIRLFSNNVNQTERIIKQ